jgi:predicted DCC family thiol-disulfide oxidoreductase YuxK
VVQPAPSDVRASEPGDLPDRIVLFDGQCALCNWTVKLLLRLDRHKAFTYAPLQGETAARLRAAHPEIPEDLDTFVYIDRGRVRLRSAALVHAARALPYPWKAGSWLWIIPWPIRDVLYRGVAAIRYRVFGKYDTCSVPSADLRDRFLP